MQKNFDSKLARAAATKIAHQSEIFRIQSFVLIIEFLTEFPDSLSWRGKTKPQLGTAKGLSILAEKYFSGYRKSDFPATPNTIPDEMVSVIMQEAYGYTEKECQKIKVQHQHSMCAENCVGNLLERYIDFELKDSNWAWCCGDFVKAIDFLTKDQEGNWLVLQIKNRNNSENSASKSVREGTEIQKWFRSYAKSSKSKRRSNTNWENLPDSMHGYNLSEEGFKSFVIKYLGNHKI